MKTLSGLQFYQFFIPNCCCWFCFWKKRRRFCHEPVGIGHWVLGLLVVWVQCCERELVRSLVTLQQEHRLRAEDGLNVPKREAGDLQICFLEAVLPKDTYRARTCKLKSNGTTTLQHLPPYAQNCMWQDSRWCTNVKRICLDLFLQRIPQAAFKLRKSSGSLQYKTLLLTFVNGDSSKVLSGLLHQKGMSWGDTEKCKDLARTVNIQSNSCCFFKYL